MKSSNIQLFCVSAIEAMLNLNKLSEFLSQKVCLEGLLQLPVCSQHVAIVPRLSRQELHCFFQIVHRKTTRNFKGEAVIEASMHSVEVSP